MAGKTISKSKKAAKRAVAKPAAAKPALLAGGNPQIAKGDGDAPVQAYIAAMPGWKRDVGRRLDALIVRTVPGVVEAWKWRGAPVLNARLRQDPAPTRSGIQRKNCPKDTRFRVLRTRFSLGPG